MSKQAVGSDSTFRDAFLYGAAKAFFTTAYADWCEESDNDDNELTDDERELRANAPHATMGADWCDIAPSAPPAAYALAGELWALLERDNATSVYVLAERSKEAEIAAGKMVDNEDIDPEDFGFDLAMQAMGHGVSWFDDHEDFEIEIPHIECSQCSFSDDAYTQDSEREAAATCDGDPELCPCGREHVS